ncbi:MAG: cytochrome c oxidase accessory protein CcoG [Ignavibacteria bacterium]|nr:cytochrome c oxidase accessory protein CcoG [Ignavibacteria bacterium]
MSVIQLDEVEDHERFRAEMASIASDGRRRWVYARQVHGFFTRWRTVLSWLLLGFLFLAPHVKIGGHQFLLFNILEREFVFFGIPFWPNDFYLVAVLFLTGIITVVLITATVGRIWCGWLCPQTVFMEMVFRKIEWWIDGPPKQQALMHAGGWTSTRIWKTALKIFVFFAISFAIANTFLAYIISSDKLIADVTDGPLQHVELFVALVTFTFVFFMVFYRFREQACTIVCPYGRYMSALVDESTIAITYDYKRGETRVKWNRDDTESKKDSIEKGLPVARAEGHGDCVDCHQCVTVCPTGIDIRNGIQLECVSCTACIDACDEVMDKVGLPQGLIRYTSLNNVENGSSSIVTPRIKAYFLIWLAMMGLVVTLFALRSDLDVVILRQEGTTWVQTADGTGNFYRLQIINKSSKDLDFSIRVLSPAGVQFKNLGLPSVVKSGEVMKGRFMLIAKSNSIAKTGTKVEIAILQKDEIVKTLLTSFVAP